MGLSDFLPIIGNVLDGISSNIQSNNARNTAYDLADKQHQYAVQDWNANNAYNSPAAQMGRFKAAGLNPNLIYGQMNNAAPIKSPDISNPGQAAPTHFGEGAANTSSNLIKQKQVGLQSQQTAQDIAQSKANIDLTNANTRKANVEADYAEVQKLAELKNLGANTTNTEFNTFKGKSLLPYDITAAQTHISNTEANTKKQLQETASLFTETELNKIRTSNDKARTIQEIASSKANMTKIPSEIEQLKWLATSHQASSMLQNLESDSKRFDLRQLGSGNATTHDNWLFRLFSPVQHYGKTTTKPYYK